MPDNRTALALPLNSKLDNKLYGKMRRLYRANDIHHFERFFGRNCWLLVCLVCVVFIHKLLMNELTCTDENGENVSIKLQSWGCLIPVTNYTRANISGNQFKPTHNPYFSINEIDSCAFLT